MRYHIGSIAMGSILRIFSSIFSFFLSRISQKLKKDSVSCGKILCAKICFCYKYYNSTLRYITELNYTFLAIFADGYLESGKKAYHLMRRNYVRIGKPAKTGTFIISIMKWVVILSGVCVTLILILFPTVTPTGIHTIEITGVSGPIIFSFILSWFVGEIFGGALEVSLNTVLLSAACDEEMFVREQRFIEPDLLEFMDGIGEEQNLQHRENMKKIRVGSESTNFDHYNTDAHYEKYGIFKIVPENSWKNSSNVSRLNASTLQKNDAEENRIASANSNLRPAEIIFNRESNLEDINEVSMEEEPIFTYGIPAEYVD